MASLKRSDLDRLLRNWDSAIRLLLLAGPDESGSREAATAAVQALGDPQDPLSITDLTVEQLRADPGLLADEAASVSMFGSARVIRVSGASEAVQEAARLLLAAPVAGNPVVMLAGNLAKTSGLRKTVEGSALARILLSYPLEGPALMRWLKVQADARGLVITRQVAERLTAAADGDTGILLSELDKFQLFLDASADDPKRLDAQGFAALAADSAEEDVGALVSAVVGGNHRACERQLRLLSGTSSIPALRALARRLVQMADARATMDQGVRGADAVQRLRPPIFPFRERDIVIAALPDWPGPRIAQALDSILVAERRIKTPAGPGDRSGWQAILALGMDAVLDVE